MPVDDTLIKKLLADPRIEDFEESLIFQSQILDKPEAAEILVGLMHSESSIIAQRARRMLCLFHRPALKPVAKGLSLSGALWRSNLLSILWTIISVHDFREQTAMFEEVLPHVALLLQDPSDVLPAYKGQPEIEYEYRVCDEAYVFIQRLRDPKFDEDIFRYGQTEERDYEIRVIRSRLRIPIV